MYPKSCRYLSGGWFPRLNTLFAPQNKTHFQLGIRLAPKPQCFLLLFQHVFVIWFYRYRYNAESANQPQSTGFTFVQKNPDLLVIFILLIFQARPSCYFHLSHILGQTLWLFLYFSYSRPDPLVIFIFLIFQARPSGSVSAHSENKLGRGLISKTGEFLSHFYNLPKKCLQPFVKKYSKDLSSTHIKKISAICFQREKDFVS